MVTMICLRRRSLITKEEMESFCKGEDFRKDSVNDDLESLFENIRLGKEPHHEAWTYFLPKLTDVEMDLVERRDTSYFETFNGYEPRLNRDFVKTRKIIFLVII